MITKEIRNLLEHTATLLTRIVKTDYQESAIAITKILEKYPKPKFSIGDWVLADDFKNIDDNLIWEIDEMYFTKDGKWRYWGEGYCLGVWCNEDELELVKRKED